MIVMSHAYYLCVERGMMRHGMPRIHAEDDKQDHRQRSAKQLSHTYEINECAWALQ